MGYNPSYRTEARIYAKHILATKPDARIGVLYQNDDFGKDYLTGLKDGLGLDHAGMIVKEVSYEVSEPAVDTQIITLHGAGADVLFIAATAKAGAQAIRKSYDLGWNATRYISVNSSSIAILKTASLEKSRGLITAGAYVEVADPRLKELPDTKEWLAFTSKYMSALEYSNSVAAYGLWSGRDNGAGAQTVRQRSLPRKHHAAGGQPQGLSRAAAPAWHYHQHLADELQSDPPVAARHIQRRRLGPDRGPCSSD